MAKSKKPVKGGKYTHVLETEEENSRVTEIKNRFVTLLQKYDIGWKDDPVFRKNKTKMLRQRQVKCLSKVDDIESPDNLVNAKYNFFVNKNAAGSRARGHSHSKNRKSEVNVVKNLLNEQESRLNSNMMSKRLKSQRQNYLLKTNQDIETTDDRFKLTSLQNIKSSKQFNPTSKLLDRGKAILFLFVSSCSDSDSDGEFKTEYQV